MAPIVISASRRTDIPAFYMPWFMEQIEQGFFEVENPYNRRISKIPAAVGQVHTIVFWSKDFGPFLDQGFGKELAAQGYHLFFNFTVNSDHPVLEPGLRPLKERLDQLTRLAEAFGPRCIQWRFDPICHFRDKFGQAGDNLDQFTLIAEHAAKLGITRCITSFVDLYRKVDRRAAKQDQLTFWEPDKKEKKQIIRQMAHLLSDNTVNLFLCCEKPELGDLMAEGLVHPSACIPGHYLVELYGPGIELKPDPGQRRQAGCGCTVSKDIGTYRIHPCHHNCLYCYANP